jgi:hypothetical protein
MQPAAVADLVLDAVTSNRFWIFPQQEFLDLAVARWRDIEEGLEPSLPEQIPGLAPRSQIVAEVMAAMLGDQPTDT